MRILLIAALGFMLSYPALAYDGADTKGRVFGAITCSEKLPCPGSYNNSLSSSALAASANSCLAQNFTLSSPSGFFEESSGLDGSHCLTTKAEYTQKSPTPQCCVAILPDKSCTLRCQLFVH
ncbi:MAG: hypothetical protein SFW62_03225 [Alphaproteobacteria bacterium]|nr:hypothetical protein [Alphaproteobacteria bacterium]